MEKQTLTQLVTLMDPNNAVTNFGAKIVEHVSKMKLLAANAAEEYSLEMKMENLIPIDAAQMIQHISQ